MSNTFILISGFKKIPFYIILSAQEHNSKIDFPFNYNMCTIYRQAFFFKIHLHYYMYIYIHYNDNVQLFMSLYTYFITKYSETCLNRTLNKPESCINIPNLGNHY